MKTKRCEQEETLNYGVRIVISEPVPIRCNECNKPVNQSDPLDFAGGLACEPCIREHYLKQYSEVSSSKQDFEAFIREELRYRRLAGPKVLKDILRQRAKGQGRYY